MIAPPLSVTGGSTRTTSDGTQFLVSNTTASWQAARSTCLSLGMDLATIKSEGMNQYLSSLTYAEAFWIGGFSVNGTWRWADGTPGFAAGDYAAWALDDNDGRTKDCISFYGKGWYDAYCSQSSRFVCGLTSK
jgi:hypothetical protein